MNECYPTVFGTCVPRLSMFGILARNIYMKSDDNETMLPLDYEIGRLGGAVAKEYRRSGR